MVQFQNYHFPNKTTPTIPTAQGSSSINILFDNCIRHRLNDPAASDLSKRLCNKFKKNIQSFNHNQAIKEFDLEGIFQIVLNSIRKGGAPPKLEFEIIKDLLSCTIQFLKTNKYNVKFCYKKNILKLLNDLTTSYLITANTAINALTKVELTKILPHYLSEFDKSIKSFIDSKQFACSYQPLTKDQIQKILLALETYKSKLRNDLFYIFLNEVIEKKLSDSSFLLHIALKIKKSIASIIEQPLNAPPISHFISNFLKDAYESHRLNLEHATPLTSLFIDWIDYLVRNRIRFHFSTDSLINKLCLLNEKFMQNYESNLNQYIEKMHDFYEKRKLPQHLNKQQLSSYIQPILYQVLFYCQKSFIANQRRLSEEERLSILEMFTPISSTTSLPSQNDSTLTNTTLPPGALENENRDLYALDDDLDQFFNFEEEDDHILSLALSADCQDTPIPPNAPEPSINTVIASEEVQIDPPSPNPQTNSASASKNAEAIPSSVAPISQSRKTAERSHRQKKTRNTKRKKHSQAGPVNQKRSKRGIPDQLSNEPIPWSSPAIDILSQSIALPTLKSCIYGMKTKHLEFLTFHQALCKRSLPSILISEGLAEKANIFAARIIENMINKMSKPIVIFTRDENISKMKEEIIFNLEKAQYSAALYVWLNWSKIPISERESRGLDVVNFICRLSRYPTHSSKQDEREEMISVLISKMPQDDICQRHKHRFARIITRNHNFEVSEEISPVYQNVNAFKQIISYYPHELVVSLGAKEQLSLFKDQYKIIIADVSKARQMPDLDLMFLDAIPTFSNNETIHPNEVIYTTTLTRNTFPNLLHLLAYTHPNYFDQKSVDKIITLLDNAKKSLELKQEKRLIKCFLHLYIAVGLIQKIVFCTSFNQSSSNAQDSWNRFLFSSHSIDLTQFSNSELKAHLKLFINALINDSGNSGTDETQIYNQVENCFDHNIKKIEEKFNAINPIKKKI